MNLAEARAYADKGLGKARELGVDIAIAIVDGYSTLVQLDRMTGASLMSPDIAEDKAVTAVNFRRPTSEVANIPADRLASLQKAVRFNILPLGGGVPIPSGGAIGVSGGTSEQDEEIARAAMA